MQKIWTFLIDRRTLSILGFLALAGFLFLGAQQFGLAIFWVIVILVTCLVIYGLVILTKFVRTKRAARKLEESVLDKNLTSMQSDDMARKAQVEVIHKRMKQAIEQLKSSKMGLVSGSEIGRAHV